MAFISVSFSFSANSTIVSSQVNQNFQDIVNGLSDGTKNLKINDLNVTGTLSGVTINPLVSGVNKIDPVTADTTIELADNTSGAGKKFSILGQDAFATSGGAGGNIVITPGAGVGSGVGGKLTITGGGTVSGDDGEIDIGSDTTKTTTITADTFLKIGITGGTTTTISQTGSDCSINSTNLSLGNASGGKL